MSAVTTPEENKYALDGFSIGALGLTLRDVMSLSHDNNDKNETSSSNKENYETSNGSNDKKCIRDDSYNERIR